MLSPSISKSQYVKGVQCPKALFLYRKRKDLEPEVTPEKQALFDTGIQIGEYARQYWRQGVLLDNEYRDIQGAIRATNEHIKGGALLIYEGTAMDPVNGCYARADILRKVDGTDQWDMIEVKSSTSVKDYHLDDVAFQYHVFTAAGYKIRDCSLMLIDNTYSRNGEIEPAKLFKLEDITALVKARITEVKRIIPELLAILQQEDEPAIEIGGRCDDPFECDYKAYCWAHVPKYSVYNVFKSSLAEVIARQYGVQLENLPTDKHPTGVKGRDVQAYLSGGKIIDKPAISSFLSQLKYPLYFLDYETIMPAVPLFDGTRPYQQIPFQFSLHYQKDWQTTPEHFEYLHKEQTDPRIAFIEHLIAACGSTGSIIVYNQTFELNRNKELAVDFPQFAYQLQAINNRVVDLLVPFRSRFLYHPNQNGSASIKDVLPAFTDLRYDDLDISHGGEAMRQYAQFMTGALEPEQRDLLFANLKAYCRQDTWAMVELLTILKTNAK